VVIIGGAAIMGAATAAFAGTRAVGHYGDAAGLAAGLAHYAGKAAGVLFAVALLDAAVIGAFAVSLSTAYAFGDVLGLRHSLHRGVRQAKGFYVVYGGLVAVAATVVLIPHSPLGLFTEGVQVLAGVLLPSATMFLLLLCNDRAVLGPWVNGRATNVFTATVIAVLIMLSLILTASVAFPKLTAGQIVAIMVGCAGAAVVGGAVVLARGWSVHRRRGGVRTPDARQEGPSGKSTNKLARQTWRMPALAMLEPAPISQARKLGLTAMWIYLVVAVGVVIFRIVIVALGH
jgi:Natural resistance-associated macrophage protein